MIINISVMEGDSIKNIHAIIIVVMTINCYLPLAVVVNNINKYVIINSRHSK